MQLYCIPYEEARLLRTDVMEMSDLKEGMVLTGTVRNVTDFGAFVDIAVHEEMCIRDRQNPSLASHYEDVQIGDIIVSSGNRTQTLTAYDLFNVESGSYYGSYITCLLYTSRCV